MKQTHQTLRTLALSSIALATLATLAFLSLSPVTAAELTKNANVSGMKITLDHPAMFHADDPLVFTLKLKNVSDRDVSIPVYGGIDGTRVGELAWNIVDVKDATVWKAVANPNPGPRPGMPASMSIKTLKPGESFDAAVRVLLWGQMFGTEADPVRTAFALPAGKYVASVSVSFNAGEQVAIKSGEFEVSAQPRPVPIKVRQTREQIVAIARETLLRNWNRMKELKVTPVQEIDLAELQTAEVKVEESSGRGMEEGQTIYSITFLAPCQKLGGKVRFHWQFNEFGRERSMSGPQLIKE